MSHHPRLLTASAYLLVLVLCGGCSAGTGGPGAAAQPGSGASTSINGTSSTAPSVGGEVTRATVDGQPVVAVAGQHTGPHRLAVVAHGYSDTETLPLQPNVVPVTRALVDAGWVVVASLAHGNDYGSPVSQQDYLNLIAWSRAHYQVQGVALYGVSMGAVATLDLAASGKVPDLLGWVGVSPVTDIALMRTTPARAAIDRALSSDQQALVDPMHVPAAALARVPMTIYTSPTDTVAPAAQQVQPWVAHVAPHPVRIVSCAGGHTAPDCYRPDALLALGG